MVIGLLESGSAFDPLEKLGLANFTASMLSTGNHRIGSFNRIPSVNWKIVGQTSAFGCGSNQISGSGGKHWQKTSKRLFDLSSDRSKAVPAFSPEVLFQTACNPSFWPAWRFGNRSTSDDGFHCCLTAIYTPAIPYGQPQRWISPTLFRPFNARRPDGISITTILFTPRNMILVASRFAVTPDKTITALAGKILFADWRTSRREDDRSIYRHYQHAAAGRSSGSIKLCGRKKSGGFDHGNHRANTPHPKDYLPAFHLGNNILGQFGLMGRIGASVRSRSGTSLPRIQQHHGLGRIAGAWEITAGTKRSRIWTKPSSLSRSRSSGSWNSPGQRRKNWKIHNPTWSAGMPLSLESNAGIANAILNMERFQLGLGLLPALRRNHPKIHQC